MQQVSQEVWQEVWQGPPPVRQEVCLLKICPTKEENLHVWTSHPRERAGKSVAITRTHENLFMGKSLPEKSIRKVSSKFAPGRTPTWSHRGQNINMQY